MNTEEEVLKESSGRDIFLLKIEELGGSANPHVKALERTLRSLQLRRAGRQTCEYHHCTIGDNLRLQLPD